MGHKSGTVSAEKLYTFCWKVIYFQQMLSVKLLHERYLSKVNKLTNIFLMLFDTFVIIK